MDELHPDLRGRWVPAATRRARRLRTTALRVTSSRSVAVSLTASVRLHLPPGAPARRPALLWVHGGGYVSGRAWHDDLVCRHRARRLGIVVASVDYRLAPAHPYPAALDDCAAALDALLADEGVDPTRIAVGGASAGAGLAAALAARRRDVPLALQLLLYPMIDDRTVERTDLPAHVPAWEVQALREAWRAYLGPQGGRDPVADLAAVARADDLTGLPPAWVGVGTRDLFHDECVAYADRLRAAGVPCALDVVPGAGHGFDVLFPRAAVSRAFVAAQDAALREALLG